MECQCKTNDATSLRNFYQHGIGRRRSSSSSLSSHESGGGGGKLKASFSSRKSVISRCLTVPVLPRDGRRRSKEKLSASRSKDLLLCRNRASMPVIRNRNSRAISSRGSSRLSNKNEEWDCSNIMISDSYKAIFSHDATLKPPLKSAGRNHASEGRPLGEKQGAASLMGSPLKLRRVLDSRTGPSSPKILDLKSPRTAILSLAPKPTSSAMKGTTESRSMKKMRVTFAEAKGSIPQDTRPLDSMSIKWYTASDHDQFLNDATVRASLTDRTMKYAAMNERSYNSSTGLTSPHVLKEYLSSPEEVIGVEHLLSAQKTARESLKRHHNNALMREQRRQKRDGCTDPELLAAKLMSASTISSHMAQERASYITLMD